MTMTFDYKSVDWKLVKKEWDKSPLFFQLDIQHGENKITFQSGLDKNKRLRFGLYVNGWMNGEFAKEDHPFKKYLNKKEVKPSKKLIDLEKRLNPKLRKKSNAEIIKACDLKSFYYDSPIFDNIDQIKKMVLSLE